MTTRLAGGPPSEFYPIEGWIATFHKKSDLLLSCRSSIQLKAGLRQVGTCFKDCMFLSEFYPIEGWIATMCKEMVVVNECCRSSIQLKAGLRQLNDFLIMALMVSEFYPIEGWIATLIFINRCNLLLMSEFYPIEGWIATIGEIIIKNPPLSRSSIQLKAGLRRVDGEHHSQKHKGN